MRFLFLGAGAIGTYVGGSLAAAGHRVTYSEQPEAAATIAEQGLRLTRNGHSVPVRDFGVFSSAAEALAAGPHDVAVFALKSFDTAAALDGLQATGADLPPILSLQNGVDNEPLIAERLGAHRVVTGTVTTAIGKPGIGQVVEEKRRGIGIALDHPLSVGILSALNDAGLNGIGYPQAGPMKWSKLLTNLTGNATSAILDEPVSALFADRKLYEVEMAVLRECLAVMAALGFRPVDLPGTPVRALALGVNRLPRFITQPALTRLLGGGRGDKMPSFHIDLHSGRGQTEVRFLNGAVVRYGADHGVPTPVNAVLTETLEALSSGDQSVETYRHNPEALLAKLH
jgi:2-dehydropantoate 2-reductase